METQRVKTDIMGRSRWWIGWFTWWLITLTDKVNLRSVSWSILKRERETEENDSRRPKSWFWITPGISISICRTNDAIIPDKFEAIFNDKD